MLLSKVISDSGEVPVSLEAVTVTRKGKQILGEGSKGHGQTEGVIGTVCSRQASGDCRVIRYLHVITL